MPISGARVHNGTRYSRQGQLTIKNTNEDKKKLLKYFWRQPCPAILAFEIRECRKMFSGLDASDTVEIDQGFKF